MHGLDLRAKAHGQRPEASAPDIEGTAAEGAALRARGMVAPAIADALNVGDHRVQTLLRELDARAASTRGGRVQETTIEELEQRLAVERQKHQDERQSIMQSLSAATRRSRSSSSTSTT